LIAECVLPAPLCVVTTVRLPCCTTVAEPWITCAPTGCARSWGGAKHAASAKAMPKGEWPATAGLELGRTARAGIWGFMAANQLKACTACR
jgi:hypothetical protein